ncbi:secreted RxLR effector protein 161-like [Photinus pyralis]|uniref:secreted RxLR effector protein 161-like n=1 Tax=Photinus pyralis TaxID=7054 RepID=UPI0012676658|nr:secreted RxLR effector protein 161-like [Photinus pyralis]
MAEINNRVKGMYEKIVGSLLYLATNTRPDIAFATSYMSQFTINPSQQHLQGIKRILRYLKGTLDVGIVYTKDEKETNVKIYTDSDWGSDLNDRKSYSGYVSIMSGGPVSWTSRKQRTVALSSAEAELLALCECVKETIWFRQLFEELQIIYDVSRPWKIYMDNMAAQKLAENETTSERSKHMDIKTLKIRDDIKEGKIFLKYVPTERNLADSFTKILSKERTTRLNGLMGIDFKYERKSIQEGC